MTLTKALRSKPQFPPPSAMGNKNRSVRISMEVLFAYPCSVKVTSLLSPPCWSSRSPGGEDNGVHVPCAVCRALQAAGAGPPGLWHLSFRREHHTGQVTDTFRVLPCNSSTKRFGGGPCAEVMQWSATRSVIASHSPGRGRGLSAGVATHCGKEHVLLDLGSESAPEKLPWGASSGKPSRTSFSCDPDEAALRASPQTQKSTHAPFSPSFVLSFVAASSDLRVKVGSSFTVR